MSKPDWIKINPSSGKNDGSFEVSANSTTNTREGIITISGGGLTKNINVNQKYDPFIKWYNEIYAPGYGDVLIDQTIGDGIRTPMTRMVPDPFIMDYSVPSGQGPLSQDVCRYKAEDGSIGYTNDHRLPIPTDQCLEEGGYLLPKSSILQSDKQWTISINNVRKNYNRAMTIGWEFDKSIPQFIIQTINKNLKGLALDCYIIINGVTTFIIKAPTSSGNAEARYVGVDQLNSRFGINANCDASTKGSGSNKYFDLVLRLEPHEPQEYPIYITIGASQEVSLGTQPPRVTYVDNFLSAFIKLK